MRYDFPIEYVRQLRITCDRIGIKSTANFWTASPERLSDAFNEIGPEQWCPRFKKLTKWLLEPFFAAALQHDWETSREYKSWGMFTDANIRFVYNALQEGIDQKKLALFFMGFLLALLCQFFGYKTYLKTTVSNPK